MLPGPRPAGDYSIFTSGYTQPMDTKLHADVLLRHAGASDVVLASADSPAVEPEDGGLPLNPGDIQTTVTGAAIPAVAGDLLILHVDMVAGTSAYTEFITGLHIP